MRRLCPGPGDRPCPDGAIVEGPMRLPRGATRCARCTRDFEQDKGARRPDRRSSAEKERKRQAVADHVDVWGWTCPGDYTEGYPPHPPHPSNDLVADHVVSVASGGPEDGPLQVMCRARNSQLGAKRNHMTHDSQIAIE